MFLLIIAPDKTNKKKRETTYPFCGFPHFPGHLLEDPGSMLRIKHHLNETWFLAFFRWVRLYSISTMMGKISRVRIVELINPPITTIASGFCVSLPMPVDTAAGKSPMAAIR